MDYSKADLEPRKTCEAMSKFKSKEIVQITAALIPAAAAVPAYCRVTGLLAPEIAFEVSLPAKWNGRFYMIGNGGHAGEALDDAGRVAQRNEALQLGFAVAQTNTGHDARKEPGATFVLSNPQKAIDYAYRAVHLTATTAKDITKEYYGKPSSRAYWNSCSNGGRQGLIEAQRFPEDFDGIVANAPWVDQTGFTIGAMWNQKALSEAPVTPAKLALLADKVMAKCDAIDGLKDGLIDDPRKCNFDPARDVPACSAGTDGAGLPHGRPGGGHRQGLRRSGEQWEALLPRLHAGQRSRDAGLVRRRNGGSGWMNMIVSAQPDGKPADFGLAENTMRYLVHKPPQPDYDYKTFDFDRDIHMLDEWSKQADAKNPDLVEVQEARRQAAHDVWVGRLDPAADDGRELLRAGGGQERSGHDRLLPAVHGARDGALRRRHRSGPPRCDDGGDQLGGKGQGPGIDASQAASWTTT